MIRQAIRSIFYNPHRYVKSRENINMHPNAILLKNCTFRFEGIKKNNPVEIGNGSMLACTFVFETDSGSITVGENTFINGNTQLISRKSIEIGSNVTIAWGCTVYDHNSHSLDYTEREKDIKKQLEDYRSGRHFIYSKNWGVVKSRPIVIHDNVWIGFESVILHGVTIGEGAIVGARSVVREDVEPWTVVAGNPAVVVKRLKN